MLNLQELININGYEPSIKHKRMSINNRSAQFASFKSLSGYEDEIDEKGRIVNKKIELEAERKEIINWTLNNIKDEQIDIEYFIKDKKKDGGTYIAKTGKIKKINPITKKIVLIDNTNINIDDILNIKKHVIDD